MTEKIPARTSQLNIRITEEEKQALTRNATAAGLPTAAFIRKQCLGSVGHRTLRIAPVEMVELSRCMAELGRLSLILHGLYRIAALGEIPARDELEQACADLRALLSRFMIALGRQP